MLHTLLTEYVQNNGGVDAPPSSSQSMSTVKVVLMPPHPLTEYVQSKGGVDAPPTPLTEYVQSKGGVDGASWASGHS